MPVFEYRTWDNGALPFYVRFDTTLKTGEVWVSDGVDEGDWESRPFSKEHHLAECDDGVFRTPDKYRYIPKREFTFETAYIGKDPDYDEAEGNSLLFDVGENQYLFIGSEIVTFDMSAPPSAYFSPIGGAAVPYPCAVFGDTFVSLIEYKTCKVALLGGAIDHAEFYSLSPDDQQPLDHDVLVHRL